MNSQFSLSIILPVYNEGDNIKETIEDSIAFLEKQDFIRDYEIIAVDDGSRDGTVDILRELAEKNECLQTVTHPVNAGYGAALGSGIKRARFPWVFLMDADGQFKVKAIQNIISYMSDYDIIAGYRRRRSDNFYRIVLGKTYTFLVFLLFGLKMRDINCGFKLFKKETLDSNGIHCRAGVFYTNILVGAKAKGYKIKEVPVEHFPRK